MAPQPPPANDQWRVDPSDVGRHRRRLREANRRTPLGTVARLGAAVLAIAVIITAYLNFDTVRQVRLDFSEITALFERGGSAPGAPAAPTGEPGEPGTEVVEGGGVAGVAMPSAVGGAPPTPAEAPATAPAQAPPAPATEVPAASEPTPFEAAAAAAAVPEPTPPPPPEPEPELPVGPETFHFGLSRVEVSEADASARIIVLREGGRRGASSVVWWTTDGTATAGTDYADRGRVTERFAVGEQNRTILIPLVGDRNVEGPENFYVHVAPGDAEADLDRAEQLEVVLNDDD
jgi:hypothetical protein